MSTYPALRADATTASTTPRAAQHGDPGSGNAAAISSCAHKSRGGAGRPRHVCARTIFPGTPTFPCRRPTCAWASQEDFAGGYDHRGARRPRSRRQSSHLARQKTMDLGQPRVRLRMGPQSHRRRRERRIRALHRIDGRRLHGQPAGLLLSSARRNENVEPVLVSDPGNRPGAASERGRGRQPAGEAKVGSASVSPSPPNIRARKSGSSAKADRCAPGAAY